MSDAAGQCIIKKQNKQLPLIMNVRVISFFSWYHFLFQVYVVHDVLEALVAKLSPSPWPWKMILSLLVEAISSSVLLLYSVTVLVLV